MKEHIKKGFKAEKTALNFFKAQGWRISALNKRFFGVEIDLILYNPLEGWLLAEVKSHNQWRKEYPMSWRQKQRLKNAFQAFCERKPEPVQIKVVIVSSDSKVEVFDLEF